MARSQAQELLRRLDIASFDAIEACGRHRHPPYEDLPKEELIRSACYAACMKLGTVFVESPYAHPATPGSRNTECDLWLAKSKRCDDTWIEIKRSWAGPRPWNNKPAEQLASWFLDVEKLADAERGRRAFVLVSFTDTAFGNYLDEQYSKVTDRLASVRAAVAVAGEPRTTRWGRAGRIVQTRVWWWPAGG